MHSQSLTFNIYFLREPSFVYIQAKTLLKGFFFLISLDLNKELTEEVKDKSH